jgi:predicted MFS family arabinose efflux permease
MAVLIRDDLGLSEARLGATVAVFFAFAALTAAPSGQLADRIGARPALRIGLSATIIALTSMAFVTSWWQVPVALAVAGFGHAVLQVASNLLLANDVAPRIQGLAFGIKQSAIPAATLAAGASVPIIATQFGWRWTYGVAAITAALVLALQGRGRSPSGRRTPDTPPPRPAQVGAFTRRELVALAVAVGLGAGAANALPSFLVAYAVREGMYVEEAGILLAVASAAGLIARIALGWLADTRAATELAWVATLLAVGGVSLAALPFATGDGVLMWVSGALAFAAGWGWPGLFTFIVATDNAHEPAAATGLTQAGVFVGAVAGPLLFGVTASSLSYDAAWRGAAVAQMLGAALLLVVRSLRSARIAPTVG